MPSAPPAPRRALRTGWTRPTTAALAVTLLAAGCAGDAGTDAQGGTPSSPLRVATSFYALQYVTERIGGEHTEVFSLTPPGVDPHDVELSPRQVRDLGEADVVLVLSGFQPPVDEAVEARSHGLVVDVAGAVHLEPAGGADDEHADDEHAHDDHGDHEHEAGDDDHDHGDLAGLDPHFWLDPNRMIGVAHLAAATLTEIAPDHAQDFLAAADALEEELRELDTQYGDGLATCERDVVVTGHTAFGYLARTYGFTEVGVAGIDPENEPSPARLREVRAVLEQHDLTTIYATGTGNTAVNEALAEAMGLEAAVLDPIEVQPDGDSDYLDLMRTNLEALRTGLGCR